MDEHTRPEFDRSALLTIDMQRDFLSESPHGIPGTTKVLPAVRRLVRAFRDAGSPIVHVVRLYLPDASNVDVCRRSLVAAGAEIVRPHSTGSLLADGLAPEGAPPLAADALLAGTVQAIGPHEHVLYKPRWGAFYRTQLEQHLLARGVTTLVVTGANYPNCPRAAIIGASERDFRVVAVDDALSQWTDNATAELAGIGVVPLSTVDVIASLVAGTRTSSC
ncbi:cysteine hydrolase [Saccharopolyspora sp. K220]|uniref:cysteine hydrolase family protein n=1 Tax=Saccharopolyspora soli TaxID=2926618 RepID=UPI001F57A81A|nr:isochorismatase family cysteine hydrolase [Saccharopolyspora soli]MCI2420605.1 cysteine hydrolase [Saccharopolyspora soli]